MTQRSNARRARGLVLLTGGIWLAACGGSVVEGTGKTEPPPSGEVCASVFACPDGQRCDGGVCVPDTTCPAAIAPRLVYTNSSDAMPGWLVTTLGGRDLVQLSGPYLIPGEVRDHESLVDVQSGAISTWNHAPGLGFFQECSAGICGLLYGADGQTVFESDLEQDAGVWSTWEHHQLPAGSSFFGNDLFLGPGTLLLLSGGALVKWTAATGSTESVVALDPEGISPWQTRKVPGGWQLVGRRMAQEPFSISYFTAPLAVGASWSPLLQVKAPWKQMPVLVQAGDQWFAIHDQSNPPDAATSYHVYRVGPGEQTEVGSSTDRAVADLGLPYGSDGRRFGDDHTGWVVSCTGGRCRLVSVNLDTVKVTEHAAVDVGTKYLSAVRTRWLACNAVDVLIGSTTEDPTSPTNSRAGSLWYTRMVHPQ